MQSIKATDIHRFEGETQQETYFAALVHIGTVSKQFRQRSPSPPESKYTHKSGGAASTFGYKDGKQSIITE